jgi:hypothetical protein
MVLARSGARSAARTFLAQGLERKGNPVRQQLGECCSEAKAKRGGPRQEVNVETGFAPFLGGYQLGGRTPTGPGSRGADLGATLCGLGAQRALARLGDAGGVDGCTGRGEPRLAIRGAAEAAQKVYP